MTLSYLKQLIILSCWKLLHHLCIFSSLYKTFNSYSFTFFLYLPAGLKAQAQIFLHAAPINWLNPPEWCNFLNYIIIYTLNPMESIYSAIKCTVCLHTATPAAYSFSLLKYLYCNEWGTYTLYCIAGPPKSPSFSRLPTV